MKTSQKPENSSKPTSETRVEIKPAKGRPMLTWVGKKPLRHATAYPAQLVETYSPSPALGRGAGGEGWPDWPKDLPQTGLLFHGDNKDVLAWLLANGFRGKVKLIYIDPPFDSGADYVRKAELRGLKTAKIDGESYGLGEQTQYTDIWANDNYLQFMYERLLLLRELLHNEGSFYLHCDWHKSHLLRCLLDEVFSPSNFRNEISRIKCNPKNFEREAFGNIHDTILFYGKSDKITWNDQIENLDSEDLERLFTKTDKQGHKYTTVALHASGERKGPTGKPWKNISPPPGRHWAYVPEELDRLDNSGLIEWSSTGNPRLILYAHENEGRRVQDIWTMKDPIYPGYPTEKNPDLVERLILASTNPNDIVLDCFLGSGTTVAVAQKLGRRWIGGDINKGAIQTAVKRLQGIIQEQLESSRETRQMGLPIAIDLGVKTVRDSKEPYETSQAPTPSQFGFAVYRVNDYDLQIQHNEAFNLAVEHLGMTRTKTDAFFDGTLGKKLVKIVPFNHPVTALDLEEVKRELGNRPEEERDLVLVGLGKELAVEAWLEEWNKLRKQGNIPNKIEVIELRSDPKYGGFFTHEPAQAQVSFKRIEKGVEITIDDFISPTILERLKQQNKDNPLFQPQVSDWRSMVDSVMIDANYDGAVFNITLADVPEKKNDLVDGKYLVQAETGATIAVKVTDMLGEEVLSVWEE